MKIIFYKRGNFYICYNDDAYILAYLLDYKVVNTDTNDMAGFPVNNLDNVLNVLNSCKISYIVYDSIKEGKINCEHNFLNDDRYYEIYEVAYEYVKLRSRIERVHDDLKEKINENSINDKLIQIEDII